MKINVNDVSKNLIQKTKLILFYCCLEFYKTLPNKCV